MIDQLKKIIVGDEEVKQARKTIARLEDQPDLNPQQQKKLDDARKIDLKRRTRVAGVVGITGATAIGVLALISNIGEPAKKNRQENNTTEATTHPTATATTNETVEKVEVTLGNVHFHLQEQGNLSSEEINMLFRNIEAAYQKLTDYFGKDVMTKQQPTDCPIIVHPKNSEFQAHGSVDWHGVNYTLTQKTGELQFTPPTRVSLTLRSMAEDVIAHEFVHLFIQANINLSEAFFEGHAHAIQKHLYGEAVQYGQANIIADDKKVQQELNIGLDDNMFDRNIFKAGVQNNELNLVMKLIWQRKWQDYLREDPEYFKKFYTKIAELKKSGTFVLSKQELMQISDQVSPGFQKWMKNNAPSMQDIDKEGNQKKIKAVVLPDQKTIYLINIQSGSRQVGSYSAGILQPFNTGPVLLHLRDKKSNQDRAIQIPQEAKTFLIIDISGGIPPHLEIEKITIGGREVPIA